MVARSLPLDDVLGEGDRRISVDGDLDNEIKSIQTNKQTNVSYNMVECHAAGEGDGTMRGVEARVQIDQTGGWHAAASNLTFTNLTFRSLNVTGKRADIRG